jgi:hypothetical protein
MDTHPLFWAGEKKRAPIQIDRKGNDRRDHRTMILILGAVLYGMSCIASFSIGYASAQRDLMERMDRFAQREMQVEKIAKQQHDNALRVRR